MNREVLVAIRDLLTSRHVLGLAVVIDGNPEASLLPYAMRADFGAVYIQASRLARHTRALTPGAHVGVLIHGPDTDDADPMQVPRLTIRAVVNPIAPDGSEYEPARKAFLTRIPGAEMTLSFGDFALFELAFVVGRYVAGFAQAYDVAAGDFKDIAALP